MPDRPQPRFGAVCDREAVTFRVWSPAARAVHAHVDPVAGVPFVLPLDRTGAALFEARSDRVRPGDRYRLRMDDGPLWPDPASRFQPAGVHGPSEVIDPASFTWADRSWPGRAMAELVIYELHVGSFSDAGTFQGVLDRLPYLRDLGVTAIELMPVAAFPGQRNWGYDGGALFAPSEQYGRPDDLRRLVDAAHGAGLAVLLDVVYNHLGPDGAYLAAFAPTIFSDRKSPWGGGLDFKAPDGLLRAFFIDNAVHWVREYHVDGLRLDATHAIDDEGAPSFLAQAATAVRAAAPERAVLVIAEDHRNLSTIVREPAQGGWGLDAVWADDFHHEVRRHLAGDADGYYVDFRGTTADLADTIRQGWFFTGQQARFFGGPRGTDPAGVPPERFVICIQNHDQVGNRARGERLHHEVDLDAYRAASVLLLLAPETPLLFMGQEWAASSPFLYFTDHDEPLGRQVTEGRRQEFAGFRAFRDPENRAAIPDPQATDTFTRSRLVWDERRREPQAAVLDLYRATLALRLRLHETGARKVDVRAADAGAVALRHPDASGEVRFLTAVRLNGTGDVAFADIGGIWRVALRTGSGGPAEAQRAKAAGPVVEFAGPGAVVLERVPEPVR